MRHHSSETDKNIEIKPPIDKWTNLIATSWRTYSWLFKYVFVGVPHLATNVFLNFQIEPELGTGIDPGMAFTPFPIYYIGWDKIQTHNL